MDYNQSKKVITINILDFDYYPSKEFHLLFKVLCVDDPQIILSDALEVHFIQLPKFYNQTPKDLEHNQLHRYLLYFQKQIDDDVLKELLEMDENIAKINERYEHALSDEDTRRLAWERERALIERNSIFSSGYGEGRVKEKIEMVIKLLTKRFKDLDDIHLEKISTLSSELLDQIIEDIFDLKSVEQLEKYYTNQQ